MKISAMQVLLAKLKSEVGDIPVILKDADTDWLVELEEKHFKVKSKDKEGFVQFPDHLQIKISYAEDIE